MSVRKGINLNFKNAELYNIEELIKVDEKYYRMSRLNAQIRGEVAESTAERSFYNCGCEIRFNLKGEKAEITLLRKPGEEVLATGAAEIYYGDFQASYQETPRILSNEPLTITIKQKIVVEVENTAKNLNNVFAPELVRILLPYDWDNYLIDIQGNLDPPAASQVPEKKILTYGSSITHGGSANHPGESYAFKLAQLLGYDLINKGFAGSAKMEPAMANYLAELDWDLAVLEMGINIIDDWSLEKFAKRIDYFIEEIALKNQDKWIFCTDLFRNRRDFNDNHKSKEFRRIIKNKVETLNLKKLKYVSGLELLTDIRGLSADFVHPSTYGMDQIANNFYKKIKKIIN